MSPTIVGIIGIVILFLLFFSGMPIGFTMILIGFLGFAYLVSLDSAIGLLGITTYATGTSYLLSVIPLFILMGQFAFYSGISRDMYYSIHKCLGGLPGGLAMATIGGCAGFAAVTGSSLAAVVTMGSVALPEMRKYKYHPSLATGCIAAGGTLGILIPPSIAFVIYAMLAEQSIGKLFLAGVFPGLLLTCLFMVTIYIITRINPSLGPRGARTNFREKVIALKGTWGILLLFLLVIGGLYTGVFVPTEAAAVGAFGAFIIALSKRSLSRQDFITSLISTAQYTAMIFIVIIGAMIFSCFLAVTKIPFLLSDLVGGLAVSRYVILGAVLAIYLILGCTMEAYSMIVLTLPIIFPAILALGFDPIWYGVIMVIIIEAGLVTPPVGLNVFVMRGVAKDVPMQDIFMGVAPFVLAMVIGVIILIVFPQIALFLPYTMKGMSGIHW